MKQLFARNLQLLRKKAGMTQLQLAERAQLSVDFVSLLERGINAPSLETIESLANALEIPACALLLKTPTHKDERGYWIDCPFFADLSE